MQIVFGTIFDAYMNFSQLKEFIDQCLKTFSIPQLVNAFVNLQTYGMQLETLYTTLVIQCRNR